MDIAMVTALFTDLTTVELTHWIEQGWVIPDAEGSALIFREIDVARVRLIHDLRRDMDVGEDAMALVLSLLDQVYELRGQMNALLSALAAQPPDIRLAVLEKLRLAG